MKSFKSLLLSEFNDLLLAVGMIGILLVLFTPISPGVLDFLLLANCTVALLILLVTFYTEKPLSFSTFPSLLLITTLFRLALNISATRLILDSGNPGKVINAIGAHVVGGNYVIGFVVFLILIVVQYVVVTNGAQRVAEVAARFTLDSLPGKQMSIDADLNMGIIDQDEAKRRRSQLERESSFYGAMDGASKFVKGDAIAGIIIILINIIGGISVGMLQKGMSWADTLHHYTLLTVGDGIVTQIPSLIISVAAGIIITRAATDAKLGQEVARQVSSHPKILVMIALITAILMVLPGLPVAPLLILFCFFSGLAWLSLRRLKKDRRSEEKEDKGSPAGDKAVYEAMEIQSFELRLGASLASEFLAAASVLESRIDNLRKQFAKDYGFALPTLHVRLEKKLGGNSYQIAIHGAVIASGELMLDRILAINPGGDRMELAGIETREPTYGLSARWIEPGIRNQAKSAGYTLVDPETVLLTHLSEISRKFAPDFMTRAETENLVERKRSALGSLLDELVPQILSYSDIQRVLQNLLREQVPIKNLSLILDVLVDAGRTQKNPEELAERVRERLGAGLYERFVDDRGELHVLTLAPQLEGYMLATSRKEGVGAILPAGELERFLTALARKAEQELGQNRHPVLLCAPSLRRVLRSLVQRAVPHLAVLAVTEIGHHARITSSGIVELPGFTGMEGA
ncbi:flagellar biosynthesis protein FlhA [Fluviicoccus keumensis]|uniref:Flagellar biosynthesis protein FlhA n=1 Tax=Fluviicoccus keumensis TaxID=1435465 RepID=A0A4Q7YNU2_9GAMM|nr:flagellar biosynthesis protein FlhA [Fluviicoccus keumensis]RZU38511.1 flagellar biosynthesis protein FlhA [Fluviicoccus keumensis]